MLLCPPNKFWTNFDLTTLSVCKSEHILLLFWKTVVCVANIKILSNYIETGDLLVTPRGTRPQGWKPFFLGDRYGVFQTFLVGRSIIQTLFVFYCICIRLLSISPPISFIWEGLDMTSKVSSCCNWDFGREVSKNLNNINWRVQNLLSTFLKRQFFCSALMLK